MGYSRRALGIGLAALGACLVGMGISVEVYVALAPCSGWCLFSAATMLVPMLVLYVIPGLAILSSGLFFLISSRKRPLVSDPWSSRS